MPATQAERKIEVAAQEVSLDALRCYECAREDLARVGDRLQCGACGQTQDWDVALVSLGDLDHELKDREVWTSVVYGETARVASRYAVMDAYGKVVFQDDSKAECIAESQRIQGWEVNGSEADYGRQLREAGRR